MQLQPNKWRVKPERKTDRSQMILSQQSCGQACQAVAGVTCSKTQSAKAGPQQWETPQLLLPLAMLAALSLDTFCCCTRVAMDLPFSLGKAWLGLAAASAPGSCHFYEAEVCHVRHKPVVHSFRYNDFQSLISTPPAAEARHCPG